MSTIRSSVNKAIAIFLGSSIGYAAYTYSSVGAHEKSRFKEANVTRNNLIEPGEVHHIPSSLEAKSETSNFKVAKSIAKSKILIEQFMLMHSVPGLSIGISYRGDTLWSKGFGFSNIEQGSKCHDKTIMRIASISKPLTMLLVAKLVEAGKLDLDKPISHYLKDKFPAKQWQGKQVDITVRQLALHLGGIRHYKVDKHGTNGQLLEVLNREKYKDVFESLNKFKDDDLVVEPGTEFRYTTYGWVLISAVVQCVLDEGQTFEKYLVDTVLRKELGMNNTYLDVNDSLIPNRASYYVKNLYGGIINAPFVENSYKWAGGGLLSNVPDLLKFGNVMLYSYLNGKKDPRYGHLKGYLNQETVQAMWQPGKSSGSHTLIPAMGWFIMRPDLTQVECAHCAEPPFTNIALHTGAATGASSILLILPEEQIVACIICNLENVNPSNLLFSVVKTFLKELKPLQRYY